MSAGYPSGLGTFGAGSISSGLVTPSCYVPLPIRLMLRELALLHRSFEADAELKAVLAKFAPYMGVEV